jgi:hypothetical protein
MLLRRALCFHISLCVEVGGYRAAGMPEELLCDLHVLGFGRHNGRQRAGSGTVDPVHSGLLDVSQISGDKYVFLFRATHSVLRTAASRAQYVESTPANQTMGSCASFVITKKGSSISTMCQ